MDPSDQERCADQIETKMGQLAEKQNQGDLKAFFKSYDRNSAARAAGTAREERTTVTCCWYWLIIEYTVDHGGSWWIMVELWISTVVWWYIRDQRGHGEHLLSISRKSWVHSTPFVHSRQSMAPLVNLSIGCQRFATLIIINQCSNSNSWHV